MQFFKKRTKKPTKAEINHLYKQEDFNNLIDVAKYSKPLGRSTAIQAAFVLGYESKGGAV